MSDDCISCGMPMRTPDEHALGDSSKPFCKYCGDEQGALRSHAEILERMTDFMKGTQGLDEEVARTMAAEMLAKLPAWADQ